MKYLILILFFLPVSLFSQALPDGCFNQVNVPAEYIEETETIHIEAVVYNVPKIEYKEQKVLVKEKAYEQTVIELLKRSPHWKPARLSDGEEVNMEFTLPIVFTPEVRKK